MKVCSSCKQSLPRENFGKNVRSVDGLHWYCKSCNNKKQRQWKKANVDKVRQWRKRYIDKVKATNGGVV